ncbi:hypothetical protein BUALT_Bualt02G0040300 [Buddleja alternifolia]|uniref:Uncharacterized protein n=1 Tax=Buddleja alternifolia TaxID=168488 RepID=A0AAV6Y596_9LAMI|nr:hypothetical protein BUALT_Bualt02G0040300 [Buddleja alternifolia]
MATTTTLCITLIYLFLILSPIQEAIARHYPILPSAPSTALPIVSSKTITMRPFWNHKQRSVFRRREVKNCMPKGLRRSSAPSRDVNYHVLGSLRCFSGRDMPKQP